MMVFIGGVQFVVFFLLPISGAVILSGLPDGIARLEISAVIPSGQRLERCMKEVLRSNLG